MTIRVLGPLDVGATLLSPRERAMLSALIVRLGVAVEPSELADAYWGDRVPSTWRQQVKKSIARIRTQLGHDTVVTAGSTYVLGIDPDAIDAVRFERLISSARQRALHGEPDRASDLYARALALWRGQPYPDLSSWNPAVAEVLRLTEIRTSAEEEWLDARLDAGEHRVVIADAERLVRADPLREDRWAILALANYRAGRQAEALATVRAARSRLLDELGIDVGPRLSELETAILRQDPDIAPVHVHWDAAGECPYPGLEPFGRDHADLFFGRDADVDALTERARAGSVLTIAGPSGSGKSSVLLAGVLPRLVADGREVAVIRPGAGGVTALRTALERGVHVVAIDQAEELMRAPADQAAEFCQIAAGFVESGGVIVLTIRSHFLDRAAELPHLGAAIGRGVYVLAPLSAEALRVAIEGPARHARLRLEAGLVELVIRDSSDRSTTLPHVSHVLRETWIRREGATLTVAGYEAAGGIAGAIAQTAETVFRSLDGASQELCRSLMLRLVERGADGASLRRRVTVAPLLEDPARRDLIDTLVTARLVTADGEAIMIAHEAIATAWPRLDGWLEEDAEGSRLMGALTIAAETWDADGRTDDGLLRGARLQAATEWVRRVGPDLTDLERALLAASDEHDQDEFRELAERAGRDRRNNRRLQWAIAGAGVLLVAAIVGGGLAAVRGGEAERAAENARVEALVATSVSLLGADRTAAALLAAEAFRRWPQDARVRSALWGVMATTGGLVDTHHTPGTFHVMEMIPGTRTALRVSAYFEEDADRPTVEVVDVETGEVVEPFDIELPEGPPEILRTVEVSADGSTAAIQTVISRDPSNPDDCCSSHLTFLDLTTGDAMAGSGPTGVFLSASMAFDDSGGTLYASHPMTAEVILVDATTGEIGGSSAAVLDHLEAGEGRFHAMALAGEDLIVVGGGEQLLVYDRTTLALTRTIPLGSDMSSLEVIADGQGGVVATGWEGAVRIILATGEVSWRRVLDPTRRCMSLHPATDTSIACGSYEGIALVDIATGETTQERAALGLNQVPRFTAIDEESLLVTVDTYPLWMRWRVDGGSAGAEVVAKGRELVDGPEDGGSLVVTQPVGGGPAQLWDLERDVAVGDEADRIVPLGSGVYARYDQSGSPALVHISTGAGVRLDVPDLPDSFSVMPGSWTGLAFAWWPEGMVAFDPSTGVPLGAVMSIPDAPFTDVGSVSESPDGTRAVITWWTDEVGISETAVVDIASGDILERGLTFLDKTHTVAGDELIGITGDFARRYDIRTLQPVSVLARASGGSQLISVSADGRTLLNVGHNNVLTLYDLTRNVALPTPIDSDVPGWRLRGGYLTADGAALLEAMPDGIRIWELSPAEQASRACALAGRELTPDEWSTYLRGDQPVDTCAELAG